MENKENENIIEQQQQQQPNDDQVENNEQNEQNEEEKGGENNVENLNENESKLNIDSMSPMVDENSAMMMMYPPPPMSPFGHQNQMMSNPWDQPHRHFAPPTRRPPEEPLKREISDLLSPMSSHMKSFIAKKEMEFSLRTLPPQERRRAMMQSRGPYSSPNFPHSPFKNNYDNFPSSPFNNNNFPNSQFPPHHGGRNDGFFGPPQDMMMMMNNSDPFHQSRFNNSQSQQQQQQPREFDSMNPMTPFEMRQMEMEKQRQQQLNNDPGSNNNIDNNNDKNNENDEDNGLLEDLKNNQPMLLEEDEENESKFHQKQQSQIIQQFPGLVHDSNDPLNNPQIWSLPGDPRNGADGSGIRGKVVLLNSDTKTTFTASIDGALLRFDDENGVMEDFMLLYHAEVLDKMHLTPVESDIETYPLESRFYLEYCEGGVPQEFYVLNDGEYTVDDWINALINATMHAKETCLMGLGALDKIPDPNERFPLASLSVLLRQSGLHIVKSLVQVPDLLPLTEYRRTTQLLLVTFASCGNLLPLIDMLVSPICETSNDIESLFMSDSISSALLGQIFMLLNQTKLTALVNNCMDSISDLVASAPIGPQKATFLADSFEDLCCDLIDEVLISIENTNPVFARSVCWIKRKICQQFGMENGGKYMMALYCLKGVCPCLFHPVGMELKRVPNDLEKKMLKDLGRTLQVVAYNMIGKTDVPTNMNDLSDFFEESSNVLIEQTDLFDFCPPFEDFEDEDEIFPEDDIIVALKELFSILQSYVVKKMDSLYGNMMNGLVPQSQQNSPVMQWLDAVRPIDLLFMQLERIVFELSGQRPRVPPPPTRTSEFDSLNDQEPNNPNNIYHDHHHQQHVEEDKSNNNDPKNGNNTEPKKGTFAAIRAALKFKKNAKKAQKRKNKTNSKKKLSDRNEKSVKMTQEEEARQMMIEMMRNNEQQQQQQQQQQFDGEFESKEAKQEEFQRQEQFHQNTDAQFQMMGSGQIEDNVEHDNNEKSVKMTQEEEARQMMIEMMRNNEQQQQQQQQQFDGEFESKEAKQEEFQRQEQFHQNTDAQFQMMGSGQIEDNVEHDNNGESRPNLRASRTPW
eukprot:TRINITY_DN704_c0_g1_i2.p1 TRINITY_DN704_c0_g1~~TRINITY_DN704_c0_g1_i2.p1  ORF type:complete len:1111 (-),score=459.59 TRINITY_DN704_c0_g1_i2:238-3480(-)